MGNDQLKTLEENPRSGLRGAGRSLWLTGAAAVILGTIFFVSTALTQEEKGNGKGKPGAGSRRAMLVEAAAAEVMSIAQEITAVGTLNSNESVIIAAETAGRVVQIAFKEGQWAAAGQVIVRLDRSILEAQRDRAEASLSLSRANRDRSEILLKDEAISQREWEETSAQWRLDEANLRLAEAQLEKTVLKAPFDGFLGLRYVSVGEYVQPGMPIVTLDDTDPIKIDFRVPEIYNLRDRRRPRTDLLGQGLRHRPQGGPPGPQSPGACQGP
jgi:membrane fusion protein (multidrug efflux system)